MVGLHFPKNLVMITGHGFDMHYAGPRVAMLPIEIFRADNTAYSKKLNKVIMMRDGKDHTKEDWVTLSRPEVAKILMEYYQTTL